MPIETEAPFIDVISPIELLNPTDNPTADPSAYGEVDVAADWMLSSEPPTTSHEVVRTSEARLWAGRIMLGVAAVGFFMLATSERDAPEPAPPPPTIDETPHPHGSYGAAQDPLAGFNKASANSGPQTECTVTIHDRC